jgi:hypothetical protein
MGFDCQLDECGISCEFGCACMSDAAGCECWCENVSLPPLKNLSVRKTRDPEAYVDFTASGMPLTRLAELFDDLFPGQILIPASKLQDKVTTDGVVRQIRLGELIGHVGLVPVRTPLQGGIDRTTSADLSLVKCLQRVSRSRWSASVSATPVRRSHSRSTPT